VNTFDEWNNRRTWYGGDRIEFARAAWNGALEEAAKLADEAKKKAKSRWFAKGIVADKIEVGYAEAAESLAAQIRSMQTTAVAAGGEGI
jgi:hypothetical protein